MEQKSENEKNKSRGFAFTDFFICKQFWENFIDLHKPEYLVIGEETCPETGKTHYQGYMHFKNPRSWEKFRKLLDPRHIECAKAGPETNRNYCVKDGKIVIEHGTCPKQGRRSDLINIREVYMTKSIPEMIDEGLIENFQQLKFTEGLMKYRKLGKRDALLVYWFWGDTGSGKSYHCHTTEPDLFVCEPNCEWFDGYFGQEAALFDDFRGNIKFSILLQLLDKYPMRVRVKGGFTEWKPIRIYITSSKPPEECYKGVGEDINQLLRRITEVRKFEKK